MALLNANTLNPPIDHHNAGSWATCDQISQSAAVILDTIVTNGFAQKYQKSLQPLWLFLCNYLDRDFPQQILSDDTLPAELAWVNLICELYFYKKLNSGVIETPDDKPDQSIILGTDGEPYKYIRHIPDDMPNRTELTENELTELLQTYIAQRFGQKLYETSATMRKSIPDGYLCRVAVKLSPIWRDNNGEYEHEWGTCIKIDFPLDEWDRKEAQRMLKITNFREFSTM